MQPGQADLQTAGYKTYFNSAERKGYSGTAVFTKQDPIAVAYGLGIEEHDHEGRVITLEYPGFFLVNVYTPNAQDGLKRLDYRMQWEDAFRKYLCGLALKKAVVVCGDMNVAATEMDIKMRRPMRGMQGLRRKSGENSNSCWKQDLWILIAICIRIRSNILGGAIGLGRGRGMQVGAWIIFLYRMLQKKKSRKPIFIRRLWVRITAQLY